MERKATAWKEYGQAALIEQLFETLPKVAEAVAQPLSKTEKIVMISGNGDDSSGIGASRITRDVTNIVSQLPAVIDALTGIDILETLKDLPAFKLSSNQPEEVDDKSNHQS